MSDYSSGDTLTFAHLTPGSTFVVDQNQECPVIRKVVGFADFGGTTFVATQDMTHGFHRIWTENDIRDWVIIPAEGEGEI